MKKRAKIEKRLSELREKLNGSTDLSTEDRAAFEKESLKLEGDFRAALDEEVKDAEKRAVDAAPLARRVECRRYIQAAMTESALDGAERELQKELRLGENSMPFAALDPVVESRAADQDDGVERRADAATVPAAGVISKPRQSVLRRVFQRTDAAWLGVVMPSAPAGTPNYPVMTGGAAGAMKAPGAAQDAEAATFTGTTIEPTRATARYLYRVEDAAKFGDLEAILRSDIREVLGDLMDAQIVSGDDTGANLSGFIENSDDSGVQDPGAKATLANFDSAFADGVDGIYANGADGVRILTGIETERYLLTNRVATGEQQTYRQAVMANGAGGFRASKRVAAPAANIQKAFRFRPAEFRGIAPVWEGISLIRDPYSGAAKGEVALTVLMLFGYAELRGSAKELRFKLA